MPLHVARFMAALWVLNSPMNNEIKVHAKAGHGRISGYSIANTTIHNSYVPVPKKAKDRFEIEGIELIGCNHYANNIHGAKIKNVTIKNLTGGKGVPTFLKGCIYENVVVEGKVSGVLFKWQVDFEDSQANRIFIQDAKEFYGKIGLALDITNAKFSTFQSIIGVPAKNIALNPEYHFVLERQQALEMVKDFDRYGVWNIVSKELVESQMEDTVVIVPAGKRGEKDKLEGEQLKHAGLLR